jgi:hypothetical protein
MRTHLPTLTAALLASACVFPNFKASKVLELRLPANKLERLECESHNGDITVHGDPAATEVALRAELSVRGYSQEEADANLHLLEVGHEESLGTLRIFGKYPAGELGNRSPTFRFTLHVPRSLAVQLVSHNGDIATTGTTGRATMETHNGDIDGSVRANQLVVTTHNGNVSLRVDGEGGLDGTVTSHNGDIDMSLARDLGTFVHASTHNGRLKAPPQAVDVAASRRSLKCRLGDGKGRLVLDTHNGDVVIR